MRVRTESEREKDLLSFHIRYSSNSILFADESFWSIIYALRSILHANFIYARQKKPQPFSLSL